MHHRDTLSLQPQGEHCPNQPPLNLRAVSALQLVTHNAIRPDIESSGVGEEQHITLGLAVDIEEAFAILGLIGTDVGR